MNGILGSVSIDEGLGKVQFSFSFSFSFWRNSLGAKEKGFLLEISSVTETMVQPQPTSYVTGLSSRQRKGI